VPSSLGFSRGTEESPGRTYLVLRLAVMHGGYGGTACLLALIAATGVPATREWPFQFLRTDKPSSQEPGDAQDDRAGVFGEVGPGFDEFPQVGVVLTGLRQV